MSLISEFRQTESAIKELEAKLETLKHDTRLKKEMEFEGKLRALMAEYRKSLRDIIQMIEPGASSITPNKATTTRKPRLLKRYVNPNTNEAVESKGGNNKTLRAWKEQYGAEVVESWVQND